MIIVRDFRYTDLKLLQKFILDWKKRKLNYDIKYLNIEKMLKCFLFFKNDKLAMLSGIDDISEFVPNTYRILTRAITTKYSPRCWGPTIEERFFSNVMAGLSIDHCQEIDNTKNIVITTNADSRISNIMKKSNKGWMTYREVISIYGENQIIWDIDIVNCKIMTEKWKIKLDLVFE
jgi:hypothetical protein